VPEVAKLRRLVRQLSELAATLTDADLARLNRIAPPAPGFLGHPFGR
jgi:hypothetical protein